MVHETSVSLPYLFLLLLLLFLNRGNTEGTNSSKMLCFMFVYACCVLHKNVSGLIFFLDFEEVVV